MRKKQKMKKIPYGRQWIDQSDINEVVKVLKSDWLSQGPKIREFEEAIAKYCGAKYAVAVSSGTAGLHLAYCVAGMGKGDEVITTPMSFLATANAAVFTGATPIFADIDYDTVNIDPEEIQKKLTKRSKAIVPVHFAGLPVDLKEIAAIARRRDLIVIEDACHALGAEYRGKKIGSCQYSDITVFSFHPVKHITTGEGGCITTNNRDFYKKMLQMRHHGIGRPQSARRRVGNWFYQMNNIGFNYRITDFQAALGLSQLRKLDFFLKRRREIAEQYGEALQSLGEKVILPKLHYPDRKHAWHLYLFRLNLKKTSIHRRRFYEALQEYGVMSQVHYIPITHHPYYQRHLAKSSLRHPKTERYYQEVVSLPMYPRLTSRDVQLVIAAVKEILDGVFNKSKKRKKPVVF
ncbi:MAG: UDP-4-amino-4,6-dideoxy-N-acetyl-beta-L-altrosamine transaminase [Candidatus Omnitrophica bacterium]|nr:UDP-4-amino-4,6-dideoxy-N-acetyl-beta-L-altrosamine transaminase [Candidatus Omnitrophota bacterium]